MGSAFFVNHLEFARAFEGDPHKATPETIAAWLQRNWLAKRGGGKWNYTPAMQVIGLAFEAKITFEQAIQHCRSYWHPIGQIENERVVRCFWRFCFENRSQIYKRSFLAAPLGRWKGRNIYIGIKVPLIRVASKKPVAVMPIFRKGFAPDEIETNLSMTVVQEFCFREGYRNIDTELVRAKGVSGSVERQLVIDRGADRGLYTSDEFDAFATKFVQGVALLAEAGIGLREPNFAGYRVWDPDEPNIPGV